MKTDRIIAEAEQNHWPVYWTYDPIRHAFELRAITCRYENGAIRTRHLAYANDFPRAVHINRIIGRVYPGANRRSLRDLCLRDPQAFAAKTGHGGDYGDKE